MVFIADAQSGSDFRFGLKASGNLNWIKPNSKNIETGGTALGFSYGLMGDYYFAENYALSTELIITHFNGSINHNDTLFTDKGGFTGVGYDYKLRYIQIPLSIKFKTKEIGYITYWAQFGIAPSFLIRARADITGADNAFNDPTEIPINSKEGDSYAFKNFDDNIFFARLPLIIGAGIEYNLAGSTSLYTGLRMDNGFSNIFVADDKTKAINNILSLNVGVFF